ncbi:hypothetical protein KOW79_022761 [Hemibagrus wyckioides]|uniref:SEA domain-containing protein n=1 Tax=Hemibagrus wyckioides TaxID=337641 RepID=A0A9D3N4C6_9TELE|nr:hypothetical protein KOW79_022761 [Hemibagrus wyckioides]
MKNSCTTQKDGLRAFSVLRFQFFIKFSRISERHLVKERGTWKKAKMQVLLVLLGLLGTSSDIQLLVHGWRRTDSGFVVPDPQDLNATAINNPVNMLNTLSVEAVNNGTDVKIFREGSQVITRRYWYPNLVIEVLMQSPATTASTTPSPTPTDFITQTISVLTMGSTKTPSTEESRPSQTSTAPYSTPEGPRSISTMPATSTQEAMATTDVVLRFTLDMTFNTDLANPFSAAFLTLARWIEEQLNIIFKIKYSKHYSHCKVNRLERGSVKVNATLFFIETIPTDTEIENTLISAWESNSTSLLLINGSVVAGQGGSSSSSPSTAFFTTLTLLLTCVLLALQTLGLI